MDFWELWVIQFAFSSALLQTLPQNSFVGCLRNFQLDLKPLDTASASFGVSPCLDGSLEKGIYFSQEGHVILANSMLLGPEFKLVFSIRPRSLTGILFHIGSQPRELLCVYMEAGKVTASVGSEAGGIDLYKYLLRAKDYQVSVSPTLGNTGQSAHYECTYLPHRFEGLGSSEAVYGGKRTVVKKTIKHLGE